MDNAVTPRIMGKGLNVPILLVFSSFLFWSWVFGFVGALLAIPATLFVNMYCMIMLLGLYYIRERNNGSSENTFCNMTVCFT
jgi:predicted PurR-regulated permease PerM